MTYDIAGGWTALAGVAGVYYRQVPAADADAVYPVLKDNQVIVKEEVTKQQLQAVSTDLPTMTFTAYAVQQDSIADAITAWGKVAPTTT